MSGCQTHIVPVYESDPCLGDKKSTKCVLDENAFIELNLPANSTQEEINAALYQSLQAQALVIENIEAATCCDQITTIQENIDVIEEDIADLQEQIDNIPTVVKSVQVTLTQSEILNPSGFSKLLVNATAGKILVPISISAYRKPGGTSYNLSGNTVGLFSAVGSLSGAVLGVSLNIAFQTSNEGTTYPSVNSGTASSQRIRPGNSLTLVAGSFSSPSVITEGSGEIIVLLTYTEITV